MKPEFIINNLKEKDKNRGITFAVTFSKYIFIPYFFKAFNDMEMPRKNIHLIVYDNTDSKVLKSRLKEEIEKIRKNFLSIRLYKSYIKPKVSLQGSGNEIMEQGKLFNIWSMWKKLYSMIYTDKFFQLEDDTIAPPWAYKKLMKELEKDENIAFVTGIETSRNPVPWIPTRTGVHIVKMKGKKLIERKSFDPNTAGIKEINAAGVYCFAARTELFKTGFEGYDPIDTRVPFFAMDNVLIWNITQHGYKCLADFDVWCAHLQTGIGRLIAWGPEQCVEQIDIWIPKANNYAHGIIINKKGEKRKSKSLRTPAPMWELK